MPLLKYTTKVSVQHTISEIFEMLGAHGAEDVRVSYADRRPSGIAFAIETPFGRGVFVLPVDVAAVHAALVDQEAEITRRMSGRVKVTRDHAERVAWRIVRDWLAVQLAMIEARQATLAQIMLPYLQVGRASYTLYDAVADHQIALPSASARGAEG